MPDSHFSFRRDRNLGIEIKSDGSSAQCLGDLPALLAGEVVALEDAVGRVDELIDIFAGERDCVAPIAVVERCGFLNCIESAFVPVVGPDTDRSGCLVVRHAREHNPPFLVFLVHSSGLRV